MRECAVKDGGETMAAGDHHAEGMGRWKPV